MINKFVHLRMYSEYSINKSNIKINNIIKKAINDKQKILTITDSSNLFAAIKFYKKTIKYKIKPIIGCSIWVEDDFNYEISKILLLIKNFKGYLQLCKLITKSWLENYKKKALIKKSWLYYINKNNNNFIALSDIKNSNINIAIKNNNYKKAINLAKEWSELFPNSYYLEIQRYNQNNMIIDNNNFINIALELNLPIVATHPILFISKKDFYINEIKNCILNNKIYNPNIKKFNSNQYFKTQKEMCELFNDIPQAIKNTIEISKKCNLIFNFKKNNLPNINIPYKSINNKEYLRLKSLNGLNKIKNKINYNKYLKRLNYELKIINNMNYSNYFLIISDFIFWAKNNNIYVGPGRGSGAGSLISYVLNITEINPIKYNLLFERFLNPNRISMPDFDIDFCAEKKDYIINYIKNKYGKIFTSQIITFNKMTTKCAIKDIGRVLNINYNYCNLISKFIITKPGELTNIKTILKNNILIKNEIKKNFNAKNLIFTSKNIEGNIRNIGIHSGGILISSKKLFNFCPLYMHNKINNTIITQYDKDDLEFLGLIKFDFLSLNTLTIINNIINLIKKNNNKFNILNISLKDKKTYNLLSKGYTTAVFQLESKGIKNTLKKLKPNKFEDIIALLALYRPGPINLIEKFCKKNNNNELYLINKKIKNILKETYGIIIYQEQIMQIVQVIANYSLGEADILRRVISKKKILEMNKHRIFFIKKALKNNISNKNANKIFDLIEKFANYGFNKSHAAAYALISYQTAYLKSNYIIEFISMNLSNSINNINKIKILINDAIYNFNIKILSPNINYSEYKFIPIHKPYGLCIRYGLGGIKCLSLNTINLIINERKISKYLDIFDFIKRIGYLLSKKILKALIYSGSMNCLHKNKNFLLFIIDIIILKNNIYKISLNQKNLYKNLLLNFKYNNNKKKNIKYLVKKESDYLGFYFSNHIFNIYIKNIKNIIINKININNIKLFNKNILLGVIYNIKYNYNKKMKKFIIINIEDNKNNNIDIIINEKLYNNNKKFIKKNNFIILFVIIYLNKYNNNKYIIAKRIINFKLYNK